MALWISIRSSSERFSYAVSHFTSPISFLAISLLAFSTHSQTCRSRIYRETPEWLSYIRCHRCPYRKTGMSLSVRQWALMFFFYIWHNSFFLSHAVCGIVLVDILLWNSLLDELIIVHFRPYLWKMIQTPIDKSHYRAPEVCIFFKYRYGHILWHPHPLW